MTDELACITVFRTFNACPVMRDELACITVFRTFNACPVMRDDELTCFTVSRTFYACPEMSQRYRLLQGFLRPGQVCCVAPRDIWFYRVVILQVLDGQQVEVYYVDFGDVTTVDSDRLCFLKWVPFTRSSH